MAPPFHKVIKITHIPGMIKRDPKIALCGANTHSNVGFCPQGSWRFARVSISESINKNMRMFLGHLPSNMVYKIEQGASGAALLLILRTALDALAITICIVL